MKKVVTGIIAVLLTGAVLAGELKDEKKELREDISQVAYSQQVYQRLTMAVDFWHDANLKGDNNEVKKYERQFLSVLEEDVRMTAYQVLDARNEVKTARAENDNAASDTDEIETPGAVVDERSDVAIRRSTFKTKKYLLNSIKKSDSFSYRFRLLNDYIELLRREVKAEKIEVAENSGEWYEERLEKH